MHIVNNTTTYNRETHREREGGGGESREGGRGRKGEEGDRETLGDTGKGRKSDR